MTNARSFAYIGQVDDFEIRFFFRLRTLQLWRLAARFHTGLYHAVGVEVASLLLISFHLSLFTDAAQRTKIHFV